MVKYLRFRKKEGEWPRWGPYMVIRKEYEFGDWFTRLPHEVPIVNLSFQFGFYVVNLLHFQLVLDFSYDQTYWEVF